MKFTILIASERRNGNCDLLAKYADKYIRANNGESEIVYLKNYEIRQCQGCMSCVFKNMNCKLEDDLYKLADRIINNDAFVLLAPTYVLTIPGKLKIVLDRFLCLYPLIKEKPERPSLSIGVASPIDWNQFQLPMMNIFLLALGYRVVNSFFAFGAGQGEVLLDKNFYLVEKSIKDLFAKELKPYKSIVSRYCPIDFNNAFERINDDLYRCPVCMTRAKPVENGFYFDENELNQHRWTRQKMEEHFKDWILTTKERFRRLLPEIYKRKKELGIG